MHFCLKYFYLMKHINPIFAVLFVLFSINVAGQPHIGGSNVYYGHLHNHTSYSDGTGTPAQAYDYAKNTAGLDFFSLADHDYLNSSVYLSSTEYDDVKAQANAYNEDGVFAAFYGFEWSSQIGIGHITIINSDDFTTNQVTTSFDDLVSWLNARSSLVAFFNHPNKYANHGQYSYNSTTPPCKQIVGMELWNSNDGFDVHYYNDGYIIGDGKGDFDEALTNGWVLGATGAGDDHSATWGTKNDYRMAILANRLTRNDLLEAMRARRFFSTMDKNIALSFMINNSEMGSTVKTGNLPMQIQATDQDGEIFSTVKLLKNGVVVNTWSPNTATVNITQTLTCDNGDYFYVIVTEADGNEAISSPIWCYCGCVH